MIAAVAMKCSKLSVSIFFGLMIVGLCNSQEEQYAGPYRVVVHQIDECDESGTRQVYMTSTRINKVSRNKYLYSTTMVASIAVNDDIACELDIAKFGNGGWRPHFIQMEFPSFCTSMNQTLPVYFNAIMRAFKTRCPIPPGAYHLTNLDMNDFKVGQSFPVFPYGKYRGDFYGKINGTLIGCIRYFVDVVPDKRAQRQKKKKHNS